MIWEAAIRDIQLGALQSLLSGNIAFRRHVPRRLFEAPLTTTYIFSGYQLSREGSVSHGILWFSHAEQSITPRYRLAELST